MLRDLIFRKQGKHSTTENPLRELLNQTIEKDRELRLQKLPENVIYKQIEEATISYRNFRGLGIIHSENFPKQTLVIIGIENGRNLYATGGFEKLVDIAREFGLSVESKLDSAILYQGISLLNRTIADVHYEGIHVNPNYRRVVELLHEIGRELYGLDMHAPLKISSKDIL